MMIDNIAIKIKSKLRIAIIAPDQFFTEYDQIDLFKNKSQVYRKHPIKSGPDQHPCTFGHKHKTSRDGERQSDQIQCEARFCIVC